MDVRACDVYDQGPRSFFFSSFEQGLVWFQSRGSSQTGDDDGHIDLVAASIERKTSVSAVALTAASGSTNVSAATTASEAMESPTSHSAQFRARRGSSGHTAPHPEFFCSFPRHLLTGLSTAHAPPVWLNGTVLVAAADDCLLVFEGVLSGGPDSSGFDPPVTLRFPGFRIGSCPMRTDYDRSGYLVLGLQRESAPGSGEIVVVVDLLHIVQELKRSTQQSSSTSEETMSHTGSLDSRSSAVLAPRLCPGLPIVFAESGFSAGRPERTFDVSLDSLAFCPDTPAMWCFELGCGETLASADVTCGGSTSWSPTGKSPGSARGGAGKGKTALATEGGVRELDEGDDEDVTTKSSSSPKPNRRFPVSSRDSPPAAARQLRPGDDAPATGSCKRLFHWRVAAVALSTSHSSGRLLLFESGNGTTHLSVRENLDVFRGGFAPLQPEAPPKGSRGSASADGSPRRNIASSTAGTTSPTRTGTSREPFPCLQHCRYTPPRLRFIGATKLAIAMCADDRSGLWTVSIPPSLFHDVRWRAHSSYLAKWARVAAPGAVRAGRAINGRVFSGVVSSATLAALGGLAVTSPFGGSASAGASGAPYNMALPDLFGEFDVTAEFEVFRSNIGSWSGVVARSGQKPVKDEDKGSPGRRGAGVMGGVGGLVGGVGGRRGSGASSVGSAGGSVTGGASTTAAGGTTTGGEDAGDVANSSANSGATSELPSREASKVKGAATTSSLSGNSTGDYKDRRFFIELWKCNFELNLCIQMPGSTKLHGGLVPISLREDNSMLVFHSNPTLSGDVFVLSGDTSADHAHPPIRLTHTAAPPGCSIPPSCRIPRLLAVPHEETPDDEIPCVAYLPESCEYISAFEMSVPQQQQRSKRRRTGKREYPVIVWCHGGPEACCRFDWHCGAANYSNTPRRACHLGPFLASQGFITIFPNFAGSIGFGLSRFLAGRGLYRAGQKDLQDVLCVGKWLRTRQAGLDLFGEFGSEQQAIALQRGVGIGGRSWGGLLTLLALHHREAAVTGAFTGSGSNVVACENLNFRAFPSIFQCGAALCPVTDFLSLPGSVSDGDHPDDPSSPSGSGLNGRLGDPFPSVSSCSMNGKAAQTRASKATFRAFATEVLGGWPGRNLEVRKYARFVSPAQAQHPGPLAPLLLLHGQADTVVPVSQTRLYAERVLAKQHSAGYRVSVFRACGGGSVSLRQGRLVPDTSSTLASAPPSAADSSSTGTVPGTIIGSSPGRCGGAPVPTVGAVARGGTDGTRTQLLGQQSDIHVAGHLMWPSDDEPCDLWEFEQEDHSLATFPHTRRAVLEKLVVFFERHLLPENFAY